VVVIIFLTVCSSIAMGADSTIVDTAVITDTILYVPQKLENVTPGVTDSADYEKKLHQNPTVALFKSMLVPGLGQIGNHQYVKAAVVIGLQTWLIGSAIDRGRDASDLHRQFEQLPGTMRDERNALYDQYLDSKDERNKFTWFAVIVTFVSMFDAFSDAHLSGFPKEPKGNSQDINLNFRPTDDNGVYAQVSYSF